MYTRLRLEGWLTGSGAGKRKGKAQTWEHLPPGPEPRQAWLAPPPWGPLLSSPLVLGQVLLLPPPAFPLPQGKLLLFLLSLLPPSVPLQPWSERERRTINTYKKIYKNLKFEASKKNNKTMPTMKGARPPPPQTQRRTTACGTR